MSPIPSVRCIVTGASGFIGRSLIEALTARGHHVEGWTRQNRSFDIRDPITANQTEHWRQHLRLTDVVIHTAGLAHVHGGDARDIERQHTLINTEATTELARAAADAGVRRFVFISTAKVFGEGGANTYSPASPAQPVDAYARSKWAAEQQLRALAQDSAMELVIIRPPLVYGPQAKANFAALQKLAALSLPLPFASLSNRRDLIGIDNLIDLIEICLQHPAAAGGTWLCADASPYSIGDMITALRAAEHRPPHLFRFPPALLRALASTIMANSRVDKIFGDFLIDWRQTAERLRWQPRQTLADIYAATDRKPPEC